MKTVQLILAVLIGYVEVVDTVVIVLAGFIVESVTTNKAVCTMTVKFGLLLTFYIAVLKSILIGITAVPELVTSIPTSIADSTATSIATSMASVIVFVMVATDPAIESLTSDLSVEAPSPVSTAAPVAEGLGSDLILEAPSPVSTAAPVAELLGSDLIVEAPSPVSTAAPVAEGLGSDLIVEAPSPVSTADPVAEGLGSDLCDPADLSSYAHDSDPGLRDGNSDLKTVQSIEAHQTSLFARVHPGILTLTVYRHNFLGWAPATCGTAFLVTANGYALTCAHVVGKRRLRRTPKRAKSKVKRAKSEVFVFAKFKNHEDRFRVKVVKIDWGLDLAVLKLANLPTNVHVFRFVDGSLREGNFCYTVGHPKYPFANRIGYISSPERPLSDFPGNVDTIDPSYSVIEADINAGEGFSGAPLMNAEGFVCGVVIGYLNHLGGWTTICVPSKFCQSVLQDAWKRNPVVGTKRKRSCFPTYQKKRKRDLEEAQLEESDSG